MRALIVGSSGCEKTVLVVDNFILKDGWIDPNHYYIYSKSLDQPKYVQLRKFFDDFEAQAGECQRGKSEALSMATFIEKDDDVMSLDNCEPYSLIVIDEWILENQDIVREICLRGRHKGICLLYLGQTYSKIPKQLIRDNMNFLCLFKTDNINLKHVYDEFVGPDMSFDKFQELCNICWSVPQGFITIDKSRLPNNGKYRNQIKSFINPE